MNLQVQNQKFNYFFVPNQLFLSKHSSSEMALQSILHDPNISSFLERIPQNEHIITLKQLIYIGIKIVSNSFNKNQKNSSALQPSQNKENKRSNQAKQKPAKKPIAQNFDKLPQNDKKFKKSKNNHMHTVSNRSDKIESTLLREISKIRVQLESLTNKVYDHYFDENQQNQGEDSLQLRGQEQADYVQSCGFNYPQDIPTFSPPKPKQFNVNTYSTNPFQKQKNNFFIGQNNKGSLKQESRGKSHEAKESLNYPEQESRGRAKSNIMHLDDTQIRQALYKNENQESQPQNKGRNKQKKSHSLIEKIHQEKKKDQQNFFYQLNVDKQSIKELHKFQESKHQPEASYRDFIDDKPVKIDHFKKKAKSKIKPLVQRDRLRYQTKRQHQNFQKGFQQYEYSANQLEENQEEEQSSDEEDTYNKEENLNDKLQRQQRSAQQYENSPEAEFQRQRNVQNPNFGFYDSKEQSQSASRRQNTFNNNQSFPDDKVNFRDNESSYSQFSQFSMSSSNSKRQVGKISRRKGQ